MRNLRFPIAVALTSVALVAVVVALAVFLAPTALAGVRLGGPPWAGGAWHGAGWGGPWHGDPGFAGGFALPPELAGLSDVPPEQRFGHFRGAQVRLTDKDGKPVTVNVTPGTVTSASATSLAITANDGAARSYTLDDKTILRGRPAQGDKVVVATLGDGPHALAVVSGADHFGPPGFGRPADRR